MPIIFDPLNKAIIKVAPTATPSASINHELTAGLLGGLASNHQHFAKFSTVADAEAATPVAGTVCYVEETDSWYHYHAVCKITRDGNLILNTGVGGDSRWKNFKLSHKMGDTGWIDRDNATLSATSSTNVRLALSGAGVYAIKGIRYELAAGNYDLVLSGAAGPKFIGIDETGTLYHQDTLWDFDTQCPVSITYWSGSAIVAAPQTEFHGIRDTVWHSYTHQFIGLQYKSGLTFTGNVQTDSNTNPGLETVQYLWSTSGVIQDEDVQATPGTGQWSQTLGSGLTSGTAGIFNHFYFNGTFITTLNAMADRSPFIYSGANGTPRWNNAGTLEDSVTGDYIVYHYFATPMTGGWSVFSRPHNAKFTSLAAAQLARPSQLTWSNYAELKHLYTAIWRVNTGWTTITHRCKLVSLQDFRTVSGGPVASTAATDHNALSNRGAIFSHPILSVYGTTDGAIPFHSTSSNGLVESSDLTVDSTALVNARFTSLGSAASGAPRIKMKKLTGTTGAAEGNAVNVAHGLTGGKILMVRAVVFSAANVGWMPETTSDAGYQYHVKFDATNVVVTNHATNSENILSKSFTVTIIYEE